jgi:uncharacterized protein YdeI (YjbR/CyaY-like superfamily)
MASGPRYFETAEAFRAWLEAHHATNAELVVGFHKRGSGRPSMTWPESVDEALCFGWIDGVRRSVDAERYTIRFTPRRRGSTWSAVNVARAAELAHLGRMHPAGQSAFEARRTTGVYSYEQRQAARLTPEHERQFRQVESAWRFFEAQPPSYRRTAIFWVTSAKQDETRARRLAILIRDSAGGLRIGPLRRSERSQRHD